jgi:hypothetical protein
MPRSPTKTQSKKPTTARKASKAGTYSSSSPFQPPKPAETKSSRIATIIRQAGTHEGR